MRNDALDATTMLTSTGSAETPSDVAAATPSGMRMSAIAVFDTARLSDVPTMNRAAKRAWEPASPRRLRSESTKSAAPPVVWMAVETQIGQTVIARRVIRQVPIASGSTIHSASAVPACAHWMAVMTS